MLQSATQVDTKYSTKYKKPWNHNIDKESFNYDLCVDTSNGFLKE